MHFVSAGGSAQEFIGWAARLIGPLCRQHFRVGLADSAVAAQAVPYLGERHDVGPIGRHRLVDKTAGLGDVLVLVRARVHLDDAETHRRLPSLSAIAKPIAPNVATGGLSAVAGRAEPGISEASQAAVPSVRCRTYDLLERMHHGASDRPIHGRQAVSAAGSSQAGSGVAGRSSPADRSRRNRPHARPREDASARWRILALDFRSSRASITSNRLFTPTTTLNGMNRNASA